MHYAKAMELNPNNADVYYNLARWVYPNADQPDLVKSIMYAKKAARLIKGERLGELYDGIGYIYLSVGMYDEAEEFYELAGDILPNWQSNSAQWWLNMIQGNFDQALAFAQKNVELYPDNNRSHLELARTYAHMEEYDTALVIFATWYDRYKEDNLDRWEYRVFSDEYKYALIKSGRDPEKGYQQIRDKIDYINDVFVEDIFNFGGGYFYDMVRLNTLIGNKEEALKYLLKIEKAGYAFGSISWAMVDPLMEDLREEPEFRASIDRGWEEKWDIQEQIRKMEAEEDLKDLSRR
jgi:tetratricopeptide (TPR) repeat protein